MRWHAHPGETAWCVSHDRPHTCTDARPCRRRGHRPRRTREQANYGEQEVQHLQRRDERSDLHQHGAEDSPFGHRSLIITLAGYPENLLSSEIESLVPPGG